MIYIYSFLQALNPWETNKTSMEISSDNVSSKNLENDVILKTWTLQYRFVEDRSILWSWLCSQTFTLWADSLREGAATTLASQKTRRKLCLVNSLLRPHCWHAKMTKWILLTEFLFVTQAHLKSKPWVAKVSIARIPILPLPMRLSGVEPSPHSVERPMRRPFSN